MYEFKWWKKKFIYSNQQLVTIIGWGTCNWFLDNTFLGSQYITFNMLFLVLFSSFQTIHTATIWTTITTIVTIFLASFFHLCWLQKNHFEISTCLPFWDRGREREWVSMITSTSLQNRKWVRRIFVSKFAILHKIDRKHMRVYIYCNVGIPAQLCTVSHIFFGLKYYIYESIFNILSPHHLCIKVWNDKMSLLCRRLRRCQRERTNERKKEKEYCEQWIIKIRNVWVYI